ncbi:MAG: YGGT family-domain-containing protein [Monoraphidium minutum]|nr:MAG: YGGT family-domain-containing protein [Monoraphidium minutum]
MEPNPLAEQLQRLQRWATNAFQPAAARAAPLGLGAAAPPARRFGWKAPAGRAAPSVALRRGAAPFAAIIPGDSVVETVFATGLFNFINLYNTALICRLVLTWFPNPPEAIVAPLSTVCDPYLNLFRGIIPPIGGTLDLSPILAFLTLNVFQSSAAALPCELPSAGAAPARAARARGAPKQQLGQRAAAPGGVWAPVSRYQLAWAKRVAASQQKQLAA